MCAPVRHFGCLTLNSLISFCFRLLRHVSADHDVTETNPEAWCCDLTLHFRTDDFCNFDPEEFVLDRLPWEPADLAGVSR